MAPLSGNRIGVLGMKPLGGGELLRSDTVTAIECLHYAMSLPTSVVITGCDSLAVLQQALEAVGSFSPMSEEQRSALLAKTARAAHDGRYELYKTGTIFDATSQNPDWLG